MALRVDESDFNLREWDRRARITRENPSSRRFSASYIRSFREDIRSSRTNFTISSTVSSPGYSLKDEIDPSTYSFTTALKALQAKTVYNNWDWLTPEGFTLNSKWDEAEKYICNPLSGEVPMECLSSKTLSGRSFRNLTNRITMSAPLIYPSHPRPFTQNKPLSNVKIIHEDHHNVDSVSIPEKKVVGSKRDVGVQSTPADPSSGSPSPAPTPPIVERSLKRHVEADDSPVELALKLKAHEDAKLDEEEEEIKEKEKEKEKKEGRRRSGCLGWMKKIQRKKKHHSKKSNIFPIFVPHLIKGC